MNYLTLLFLPVLFHIVYTDIRNRKISLIALLIFAGLSIFRLVYFLDISRFISIVLLNFMFLLIVTGIVYLYSILRKKSLSALIGIGDVIFFVIAAINFAPLFFLLFVIISTFFGLILVTFGGKTSNRQIPFAGLMAAVMIISIVLEQFKLYSGYNDTLLLKLII